MPEFLNLIKHCCSCFKHYFMITSNHLITGLIHVQPEFKLFHFAYPAQPSTVFYIVICRAWDLWYPDNSKPCYLDLFIIACGWHCQTFSWTGLSAILSLVGEVGTITISAMLVWNNGLKADIIYLACSFETSQ